MVVTWTLSIRWWESRIMSSPQNSPLCNNLDFLMPMPRWIMNKVHCTYTASRSENTMGSSRFATSTTTSGYPPSVPYKSCRYQTLGIHIPPSSRASWPWSPGLSNSRSFFCEWAIRTPRDWYMYVRSFVLISESKFLSCTSRCRSSRSRSNSMVCGSKLEIAVVTVPSTYAQINAPTKIITVEMAYSVRLLAAISPYPTEVTVHIAQ
mmetsp:Transcript_16457/g.37774  ORF Transcript_16457/g.37774 Transcript_16457/m.37774 type:complete len:207 (-) Transcript_16457:68-688(-)